MTLQTTVYALEDQLRYLTGVVQATQKENQKLTRDLSILSDGLYHFGGRPLPLLQMMGAAATVVSHGIEVEGGRGSAQGLGGATPASPTGAQVQARRKSLSRRRASGSASGSATPAESTRPVGNPASSSAEGLEPSEDVLLSSMVPDAGVWDSGMLPLDVLMGQVGLLIRQSEQAVKVFSEALDAVTRMDRVLLSDVTCLKCLDIVKDPCILTHCGHTYCRACVEAMRPGPDQPPVCVQCGFDADMAAGRGHILDEELMERLPDDVRERMGMTGSPSGAVGRVGVAGGGVGATVSGAEATADALRRKNNPAYKQVTEEFQKQRKAQLATRKYRARFAPRPTDRLRIGPDGEPLEDAEDGDGEEWDGKVHAAAASRGDEEHGGPEVVENHVVESMAFRYAWWSIPIQTMRSTLNRLHRLQDAQRAHHDAIRRRVIAAATASTAAAATEGRSGVADETDGAKSDAEPGGQAREAGLTAAPGVVRSSTASLASAVRSKPPLAIAAPRLSTTRGAGGRAGGRLGK